MPWYLCPLKGLLSRYEIFLMGYVALFLWPPRWSFKMTPNFAYAQLRPEFQAGFFSLIFIIKHTFIHDTQVEH